MPIITNTNNTQIETKINKFTGYLEKWSSLSKLCVVHKILSSEYQIDACGKIFFTP